MQKCISGLLCTLDFVSIEILVCDRFFRDKMGVGVLAISDQSHDLFEIIFLVKTKNYIVWQGSPKVGVILQKLSRKIQIDFPGMCLFQKTFLITFCCLVVQLFWAY